MTLPIDDVPKSSVVKKFFMKEEKETSNGDKGKNSLKDDQVVSDTMQKAVNSKIE